MIYLWGLPPESSGHESGETNIWTSYEQSSPQGFSPAGNYVFMRAWSHPRSWMMCVFSSHMTVYCVISQLYQWTRRWRSLTCLACLFNILHDRTKALPVSNFTAMVIRDSDRPLLNCLQCLVRGSDPGHDSVRYTQSCFETPSLYFDCSLRIFGAYLSVRVACCPCFVWWNPNARVALETSQNIAMSGLL